MNKILIVFLTFILSSFSALADFTPLEEKVVELRNVLSKNKTIKKSELEDSLLSIRSKTSLIKNDIARTDLTGDVDILLKKRRVISRCQGTIKISSCNNFSSL